MMDESSHPIDEARAADSASDGAPVRLVLSPSMSVEQIDAAAATIYLRSNGARIRIPRALYDLLLKFETPRSVVSVAGTDERNARVAVAIANLLGKGFLLAEGELGTSVVRRLATDPPVRLFDCPAQKLVPAQTDVVVLGVPYDLSDRSAAGARNGPTAIRDTSLQVLYGIDKRTGRPLGWYDADRDRPILQGVSIGDCGDVFVDYGESQADVFARIAEVLDKVTQEGSLPVLLGGDASIGFPAIALLQARQPLAVIRIGCVAHAAGATHPSFVSPSTLPDRVLNLPGVSRYVHIGACGRADGVPPGFAAIAAPELKRDGVAALGKYLEDGQRIYVGLDMNALEMPTATADRDPESGRFAYTELHSILCGIGAKYSIAGLDLVGSNPLQAGWGVASMTAVHLLLTALSAAKDQHEDRR